MIIGALTAFLLIVFWLTARSIIQLRDFNRTIYLRSSLGKNSAVGISGDYLKHRHYVLVTVDSKDCVISVEHYDSRAIRPHFHPITKWRGISLNSLVNEALRLDGPMGNAVIRAIQLLITLGNNQNVSIEESTLVNRSLSGLKKIDELSECSGYIVAPHVTKMLTDKMLGVTADN